MGIEILSPCGSFEALQAALRTGCDGVYAGSKLFSARHNAQNFSEDELEQAVRLCHRNGVKFYQAINTVVFDSELDELANELETACKIGVDGIIVQDLAVAETVKRCCPKLRLHASTQMSLHTPMGMDFARDMGFVRAVAARELSYEELSALCGRGIEVEAFVHGALCMCFSGQCYMSAMIGSRSANRGRCAQACRLPFSNGLPDGDNCLSLKDMCLAEHIGQLENAGIASAKIEGRMKRPEYTAAATDTFRKAIDGEDYEISQLKAVFSRSGFTDGYFTGKRNDMFGIRRKEDVVSAETVLPKLRELYRKERKITSVHFKLSIACGQQVTLEAYDGHGSMATASGETAQQALNRPVTEEMCLKQLSKLGDTIYELGSAEIILDGKAAVSAGELNKLRRDACEALDNARIAKNAPHIRFDRNGISLERKPIERTDSTLRADLSNAEQLKGVDPSLVELASVPVWEADSCADFPKDKLAVSLPAFMADESAVEAALQKAKDKGITKGLASNYAHMVMLKKHGFEIHGDMRLNAANSLAVKVLAEQGAASVTLSPELKLSQINRLCRFTKTAVTVSGRLPLMLTRNCPIGNCRRCRGYISDRTGRKFPVVCHKQQGYTEILNSELLWLGDKLSEVNADYLVMKFYQETPSQVKQYVKMLLNGEKPDEKLTRGLYYRGVE